jgi:hypothetical protein
MSKSISRVRTRAAVRSVCITLVVLSGCTAEQLHGIRRILLQMSGVVLLGMDTHGTIDTTCAVGTLNHTIHTTPLDTMQRTDQFRVEYEGVEICERPCSSSQRPARLIFYGYNHSCEDSSNEGCCVLAASCGCDHPNTTSFERSGDGDAILSVVKRDCVH